VAIGIVIGLGLTVAATRALHAVLYHVSPVDGPTLATAVFVFAVIALVAAAVPARRAAAIDPIDAMRTD